MRHADPLTARARPHDDYDRAPDRRPRVGFVSSNFSAHPEGQFLRPVLASLDRDGFETFCYSNPGPADGVTVVLRQLCDGWRDVRPLTDERAAALVR